jgi:Leucine-rich repeat (LRR) protein
MRALIITLLLVTGMANSQIVNITDPNFKSAILSNQVALNLLGNPTQIDQNLNGEIEVSEAANISYLSVYDSGINDITGIQAFTGLNRFDCSRNNITSINLTGLTSLTFLDCSFNNIASLNLGITSLTYLNCQNNQITSIDLTAMTSLTNLLCDLNLQLTSINVSGLTQLQALNLGTLDNLTQVDISGCSAITSFNNSGADITHLNASNCSSLTNLTVDCYTLESINIENTPALNYILIRNSNVLTSISITNKPNLQSLMLDTLVSLSNLVISNCPALTTLNCYQTSVTSLDVSTFTNLTTLVFERSQLTSLSVSNLINLVTLRCDDNNISSLDVSNLQNLTTLNCSQNLISTLDVSNLQNLTSLSYYDSPNLISVFQKNGRNESTFLASNPNLRFICADDSQVATIQTQLNNAGMTSVVCNSYCSFTPGGNYNTIIGNLTFDENNNGCDSNDPVQSNIKVNLGIPTVGSTFTNAAGNYIFYTDAGSFSLIPAIENPTLFTISPNLGTAVFADNDNNTVTQNFCISPNGSHPDLEVVIAPTNDARPGFDASYKIVFKNKGNQTLSGNVELNFDDSRLDFLSALPAATTLAINSLNWAYSNLMPFESRAISVVFEVNTPEETPAVNIDDVLDFTTSITPVTGDELPSDNAFTFHQTVVGSMDPNDIICLEGNVVPPSEIGNYLHYVIRFENTGNYYAENVVVKDIIDTNKYDINSLQLLNTSHPSYTRITGNVVEFIFEDINLAAAAGSPPVGGHGDVLFKIKSKNTLVDGDSVLKSGKIYFDYNAPITTNNAVTIYQTLSNGIPHLDNSITIYPNPANSILSIECNSVINTIELYDIQGRLLETEITEKNKVVFDISSKQNGIYFLKITSEKGSKVEKIVKE